MCDKYRRVDVTIPRDAVGEQRIILVREEKDWTIWICDDEEGFRNLRDHSMKSGYRHFIEVKVAKQITNLEYLIDK
jgi:hypothetical protein